MNKSQLLQEFDKKVKEVQNLTTELLDKKEDGDSRLVEFGMKTITNDEIYTVPDWTNIRKFIESAFKEIELEQKEAIKNCAKDQSCSMCKEFLGSHQLENILGTYEKD